MPKPLLAAEFSDFLVEVSQASCGKPRKEVKQIVRRVAVDKGKRDNVMVSQGWFKRFPQRQTQLSYRNGDPTANVHMKCPSNFRFTEKCPDRIQFVCQLHNIDSPYMAMPQGLLQRKAKMRLDIGNESNWLALVLEARVSFVIFDTKRD